MFASCGSHGDTLCVAHSNVRSLLPHFASIKGFIAYLQLDVLTVGETWLCSTDDSALISINNYACVRSDPPVPAAEVSEAIYSL